MASESAPVEPADSGNSSPRRRSRRSFLKTLALAAPVLAGAAIAPATVAAATRGNGKPSLTTAETAAQRLRNLAQAWSARSAVATELPPSVASQGLETALAPTTAPAPAAVVEAPAENVLIRMQRELRVAMEKPMDQRQWIMVIDLAKCVGCNACTMACKAENHLPPGVVYMPVIEQEIGEYPNVTRRFMPHHCMQCDDPPCVPVCPVNATWKRADGIVVIDYNACIGCRYCLAACPYGARYFDFGEDYSDGTPAKQPYEESPSPEYGREWQRNGNLSSPVGNARKCQFCIHRLNVGMLPACINTCIGQALFFGDKNDPDSLVNELRTSGRVMRLKEELGTEPKVYYLV